MKTQYPAHIKMLDDGTYLEQSCTAHCRAAAAYAYEALAAVGVPHAAYLAGLLHDVGKWNPRFTSYLRDAVYEGKRGETVIHTFAAVRYLLEGYHDLADEDEYRILTSELLAYAVGAHHGLFDCVDELHESGFRHRRQKGEADSRDAIARFLADCASASESDKLFDRAVAELTPLLKRCTELARGEEDDELFFYFGMVARLLLSAVMEGDCRDTAQFTDGVVFPEEVSDRAAMWRGCLARVEQKLGDLPCDSAIGRARAQISARCREAAELPCGVFRLSVPTGAGKTLSGLRFALAHAAKQGKSRILFTSPLLSILDQNAEVIRAYVGDDSLILEHHSNVVRETGDRERDDRYAALAQTYHAPIVITTLVQLLNTLFDGGKASIRRFHALADSVIVIDEVQTVPPGLLTLFYLAVNFLAEVCRATVVLCSATQPCTEAVRHSLIRAPQDIVPYDPTLWEVFRRTVIVDGGSYRLEEIPSLIREKLRETDSLLVVCNKKSQAEMLYRALSDDYKHCFHLSASMCMRHRKDVLRQIYAALDAVGTRRGARSDADRVVCLSTQVIEAGVDISFGRVIRFAAGMDSVVQSAGRCNRNGESEKVASVDLIDCADEDLRRLPDIGRAKTATDALLSAMRRHGERFRQDLASDEAIEYYYRALYQNMPEGYQDGFCRKGYPSVYSLLSDNSVYADDRAEDADRYYLRQAFRTAGDIFSVFESETRDVIVPYGRGREIIAALCSARAEHDAAYVRELLEAAKGYTVSLYGYQKQALEERGALMSAVEGRVLMLRDGYYDDKTGLRTERRLCDAIF